MGQTPGNYWKFDTKTAARIIQSIRLGNFVETAAVAAGVKADTMRKWVNAGRRMRRRMDAGEVVTPMEEQLARFAEGYTSAQSEAEEIAVNAITAAGKKDWRALAWRLERIHPDRFARRERIEHSSPGGGPLLPQAAAVLFLPPNGRDVDAAGAPSKVGTAGPPAPPSSPPPPAPPEADADDELVVDDPPIDEDAPTADDPLKDPAA